MVNVRGVSLLTVGKKSSVDKAGSSVVCRGDASAYMYKHTKLRVLN